jgi:hypothetical protein
MCLKAVCYEKNCRNDIIGMNCNIGKTVVITAQVLQKIEKNIKLGKIIRGFSIASDV